MTFEYVCLMNNSVIATVYHTVRWMFASHPSLTGDKKAYITSPTSKHFYKCNDKESLRYQRVRTLVITDHVVCPRCDSLVDDSQLRHEMLDEKTRNTCVLRMARNKNFSSLYPERHRKDFVSTLSDTHIVAINPKLLRNYNVKHVA